MRTTGGPSTAPMAQPSESRMRTLSACRAASEIWT